MLKRIKRRARNERGAVLALVAILMVAIIGFAALAIDTGSWEQTKQQVQNAADAGALAAADDLPTSTSTATTDAQTYATRNLPGVPTSCGSPGVCVTTPYNGNSSQVKVTVAINGSGGLGSIFGISKPMISASAIATATSASTPITTALFAGGSNCTYAVNIDANNSSIPGGIETNGGVNLQGSNSSSFGTIDYNPSCGILNNGSMNNTYTPVKNSSTLPYPIDYRNQTITCTNGTMSVSNGVYSYSVSNDSYSSGNLAPGVYCAQSIDLTGTVSGSNVTFIADNLQLNSSGTFTAPSSTHLLVWETGTGELDVNSNTFLNSDVLFAPSATINVQSVIGTTYYTLLESNAVTLSSVTSGGSLTPPSGLTTTSSSASGASQLSQ